MKKKPAKIAVAHQQPKTLDDLLPVLKKRLLEEAGPYPPGTCERLDAHFAGAVARLRANKYPSGGLKCVPDTLSVPPNVFVEVPQTSPPKGGGTWDGRDAELFVLTQEAVDRAAALAGAVGTGWTGVVWYNLGWHYRAEKGVAGQALFYLTEDRQGRHTYECGICDEHDGGSNNWSGPCKSAAGAVKTCIENQRGRVDAEQRVLDAALDVLAMC